MIIMGLIIVVYVCGLIYIRITLEQEQKVLEEQFFREHPHSALFLRQKRTTGKEVGTKKYFRREKVILSGN